MPAGIENFALGLVQGMNARKAEQRQAEQDQMRKQKFDLQQEALRFDLTNAKAGAENRRVDRERALALQARGDAFNKHFNSAYTLAQSGDEQGAITTLANGFNDPAFGMPYRAIPQIGPDGKMVKDKNGKYVIGYADPSGKLVTTQSWTLQDALSGFRGINDAAAQYDKLRESQAKASERAAEKKDKADALTLQYDLSDRNNARSAERQEKLLNAKAALGLAGAGNDKAPADRLSKDGLAELSIIVKTIDDEGNTTTKRVVDTARLGQFQAWSKSKGVPPNDYALQLWLGETHQVSPNSQPESQEASYDFSELE